MIRPGWTLGVLIFLSFGTIAPAQTITDAFTELRNHINGITTLTAAQINAKAAIINQNVANWVMPWFHPVRASNRRR